MTYRWLILERILVDCMEYLDDPLRQDKKKNLLLYRVIRQSYALKNACNHLPRELTSKIQEYLNYVFWLSKIKETILLKFNHGKLSPLQIGLINRISKSISKILFM